MRKRTTLLPMMALAFMLSACSKYNNVETHSESQGYGKACPNPTYVATVARDADKDDEIYLSTSLRLAVLVKEAKAKYGDEVTIENVRWDLQNGKRRSVVYDVIKCK